MTMTSPLRGPGSPEGGGFAAAHHPGAPHAGIIRHTAIRP
jgi:hypothetical protein